MKETAKRRTKTNKKESKNMMQSVNKPKNSFFKKKVTKDIDQGKKEKSRKKQQ